MVKSNLGVLMLALLLCASKLHAHDLAGHHGPTYEVAAVANSLDGHALLRLTITDEESGAPTPARFSIHLDGAPYVPTALGEHGLHFTSIHAGRNLRYPVTYARGTGPVAIPLPASTQRGTVFVTKGYEYLPVEVPFEVKNGEADATAVLRRWTPIRENGWLPADEHLHYDRLDPNHDPDWLIMLAADGLAHGHFLVLRGGALEGPWATQFAYGKEGEVVDEERWIRPGEEYRDTMQGHINLLGLNEVIQPISTGGTGDGPKENYPPLGQVLLRTRELGGIGGPAHGATLARSTTGVLDAVLGAVEFFEIANTHLYALDAWYALMNCGIVLPPAAGTDLPNYPFRDTWQPFLGETRMYVKLGAQRDFEAWKQAVREGRVFITSGPMIELDVSRPDAKPQSGILRLPAPGMVRIHATLSFPAPLESIEIFRNGEPLTLDIEKTVTEAGVHVWRIDQRLEITESCWIAARGAGPTKDALLANTQITQRAIAHTAAIQVLVGDQPIAVQADFDRLIDQFRKQQARYAEEGKYADTSQRDETLRRFDEGVARLEQQAAAPEAED